LHQLTTQLNQLDRIAELDGTGSDQSRVFAQAMAGDEGRLRPALGLPQAPQGNGSGEDGGLGLVGFVKALLRALLGQSPQVITEYIGGLGKGIAHQRLRSAQLGQHAQRLRALARKDKCEGGRHQNFPLSDRKEWWRSMAAAGNCRLDGAERKAVTVTRRSTLEERKRLEFGNDAAAPQET